MLYKSPAQSQVRDLALKFRVAQQPYCYRDKESFYIYLFKYLYYIKSHLNPPLLHPILTQNGQTIHCHFGTSRIFRTRFSFSKTQSKPLTFLLFLPLISNVVPSALDDGDELNRKAKLLFLPLRGSFRIICHFRQ